MHDYRIGKDKYENDKYILNYNIDHLNKKIEVNYADNYSKEVEYNLDNIKLLDSNMENQMKKAISNEKKFVINRSVSASIIAGTSIVSMLPLPLYNSKEVTALFGVIVFSTLAFSIRKVITNTNKLDDIEKAKYYYEHRDMLDNMEKYSNYKDGARSKFMELLEEDRPLAINNYDKFYKDDLENLVNNIIYEKENVNIYTKK